jgi:hypothetical protein
VTLPNFLIIGAGKSGTTSLYHWLREHPDVFLPSLKEPFFLTYDPDDPRVHGWPFPITSLREYEALFDGVTTERAIGEATPAYLDSPIAPDRIRELLGSPRMIVSLRDPVSRVFSYAQMAIRLGRATDLAAEVRRRTASNEHLYAPKLKRYFDMFGHDAIAIVLYDDVIADPDVVCARLFRFLDVDDGFAPRTGVVHNPGGLPRSRLAQWVIETPALRALKPLIPPRVASALVARIRKANLRPPEPLDPLLRVEVAARFRGDVLLTQELIQRDLTGWLGPGSDDDG